MNKNSIWSILIAIVFISCLSTSKTFVLSQQFENEETDSQQSLGKPCTQAFHCWRTEPVQEDGIPLSLASRISKRIDLAGIARTRGGMQIFMTYKNGYQVIARCRCKESVCQYFVSTQQRFLPCEEF